MTRCFLNDQIVEQDQATLSVSDSGFLYGMGLFETLRADRGRVFALSDHLDRLLASAAKLSIPCPFDKPWFEAAIHRVLQANELTDARIRLTLSSGPIRQDDNPKPTVLITAAPFQPYPRDFYEKGIRVTLTDSRQNPADPNHRPQDHQLFFAPLRPAGGPSQKCHRGPLVHDRQLPGRGLHLECVPRQKFRDPNAVP